MSGTPADVRQNLVAEFDAVSIDIEPSPRTRRNLLSAFDMVATPAPRTLATGAEQRPRGAKRRKSGLLMVSKRAYVDC
jgi:hypothetical protein